MDEPIVKPVVSPNTPKLGRTAVIVSSESDIRLIDCCIGIEKSQYRTLFLSRLYPDIPQRTGFAIAGPAVGAPYAVMLLETLIAWGAKEFIFLGWCGAIRGEVSIGDIIVPDSAFIDEGTSVHYGLEAGDEAFPDKDLARRTRQLLMEQDVTCHRGAVWSTDAIYRETPSRVKHYRNKGALAVEMEVSAMFSVGTHHHVNVAALLVVSDELSDLTWRPGFKTDRFKNSRKLSCDTLVALCRKR